MILASRFGFGFLFISSLIFAYCLIIISAIDFEHQLIPVNIIFILIFSGLFVNYFELFTDIKSAVLGVVIGYSFFWIVNAIFKLIKKADGIGEGDFVLLAACGAWVGWQHLSIVVLISSLLCLVYAYILSKRGVEVKNIPLPYGPFIAIASLICLIYGNFLNTLV
jgi:leader peptidase (prepilin peptidase)/N-methyltransferase